MSILIKGMEMPKSCADCDVACRFFLDRGLDGLLEKICRAESRLPDCPLVPVPPHGRLGDLDAFESVKYELPNGQKAFNRGFHSGVQFMQRLIMDAPTIIPAEEQSGNSGELEDKP